MTRAGFDLTLILADRQLAFGHWLAGFGDPMSTRYNDSSHYENHQRAAELQNAATHTHRAAEQTRGKQERLSDHEQTRQAAEHNHPEEQAPDGGTHGATHGGTTGHGVLAFTHGDIAARAYSLWEERGCPEGSSDEDWYRAVKELRSLASSIARA